MESPPYSPDLNPIENVWRDLKYHVMQKFCRTVDEIAEAVEEFRQTLTPEKCESYIRNLKHVYKIKLKQR